LTTDLAEEDLDNHWRKTILRPIEAISWLNFMARRRRIRSDVHVDEK
jgi:hypothetical protein